MKVIIFAAIVSNAVAMICVAAEPMGRILPTIPLRDALRLAEEYVQTNRIDVSQHVITGAGFQATGPGPRWRIAWGPKNSLGITNSTIYVNVDMKTNLTVDSTKLRMLPAEVKP